jgi:hypothetical protein
VKRILIADSGGSIEWLDAHCECTCPLAQRKTGISRQQRCEIYVMRLFRTLPLSAWVLVSACTGSQTTLALQPAFDVATSAGPASVSIRETLPEMTFAQFEGAVSAGMHSAIPTSTQTTPVAPFPARRIVWHVYPIFPRGASRLVVNVFDGSRPTVETQQVIDNTAPRSSVEYTVRTLTLRLMAKLDQRNQQALG